MSDTAASLGKKLASAGDLQSVVRTMKAMAASGLGQYESAVRALDDYYRTVQLGLVACFQESPEVGRDGPARRERGATGVVVFGSDQGLVGQFNDVIVDFAVAALADVPGKKVVWAVGERIEARLADTALVPESAFVLPNSIGAITPLVGQMLMEMEAQREKGEIQQLFLFHNRPEAGAIYTPRSQRLLPLDAAWRRDLAAIPWPGKCLPQVMQGGTLLAFLREYLFVSLFRSCAESLASENASRLAAMQRAEKNIDELLADLNLTYHHLRQGNIDEELFDLISGFEALAPTPSSK